MGKMQTPIRVLCVFSRLDRGGAETMCMELYRHIDRSKVQFDFIKHTPDIGEYEEEIKFFGGRVYEAPQYKLYNHFSYCNWWKKHLLAHTEHQIIHGHFFSLAPIFFRVCHQMNRITIGHSHTTKGATKTLRAFIRNCILKKIESRSDYCFACSEPSGKWLFPHKSFMVLNNAIDIQKFVYSSSVRQEVQKEFGLSDNFLVVGVVGSIYWPKNPFGTVEIFNAVHDKASHARLLWAGDGEMRGAVENKIKELGLKDIVTMTGVRPDVHRLMQAMDVFIMPSLCEGLPVVGIEAQAAGLPCIFSSNITTELQKTDLCKFLPLDDYGLWAREILSAKIERRDMSEEIRKAGYDIHTTVKWLQDFYLRCTPKTSVET